MIYFLVNNNYHFIDVLGHCKEMKKHDMSLIQIPHTLELQVNNNLFKDIHTFYTPFKGIKNYFNPFNVKKIEKKIDNMLSVSKNDVLFIYTEYEILNQYIINKFKKSGARVYLIEEGFMTYNTYSVISEDRLLLKDFIKLFYLKYILSYKYVEFLYFNNIVFPQINEKYIDGVLFYRDAPVLRKIKKYLITKTKTNISLDDKMAIFLNEKMYDYYCTKDEYIVILDDILKNLSQNFKKIYFKFHPRENKENINWQLKIVHQYSNIIVIEDNAPIENILEQYNAKYIFSYFSVALLNVHSMNAVPIYIFHLYDNFANSTVLSNVEKLLKSFGYKFLKTYDKFYEVGFQYDSTEKGYSLNEIVKLDK